VELDRGTQTFSEPTSHFIPLDTNLAKKKKTKKKKKTIPKPGGPKVCAGRSCSDMGKTRGPCLGIIARLRPSNLGTALQTAGPVQRRKAGWRNARPELKKLANDWILGNGSKKSKRKKNEASGCCG